MRLVSILTLLPRCCAKYVGGLQHAGCNRALNWEGYRGNRDDGVIQKRVRMGPGWAVRLAKRNEGVWVWTLTKSVEPDCEL